MPYFSLWRESDNTWHGTVNARDAAHAVAMFSEKMRIAFTLEEGSMVPGYMMARKDSPEPGWGKPPDIPVWVKDADPAN